MLSDKIIALPDLELKYSGALAWAFRAMFKLNEGGKLCGLTVCMKSYEAEILPSSPQYPSQPFLTSLATLNPAQPRTLSLTHRARAGRGSGIWNPASQAPGGFEGHDGTRRMWSVEK